MQPIILTIHTGGPIEAKGLARVLNSQLAHGRYRLTASVNELEELNLRIELDELDQSIEREIIVRTHDNGEAFKVMEKIHHQLIGNDDYINSAITLSDSPTRNSIDKARDNSEGEVTLSIFNNHANPIPEIKI